MKKLVLIRHGESDWNKENRFTGWTDVDLTDQGTREAQEGARAIQLYLHPLARVSRVSDQEGKELPFLRDHTGGRSSGVDNRVYDDSLIVLLEDPWPAGESRELRFEYEIELAGGGSRLGLCGLIGIEPKGSDVPYALHVDRRSDTVWICGTNSDTLIQFEPASERFTVYPLPSRVTYTRELDFDERESQRGRRLPRSSVSFCSDRRTPVVCFDP